MKSSIKRLVSWVLTLVLCTSLFPLSSFAANGPNTSDPYAAAYVYIAQVGSGSGTGTHLYNSKSVPTGTVSGATYSSATNTLTLDNFNGADMYIETNMMGDDFTVSLTGSNSVGKISVWGWGYGASLRLTGAGSLTVNASGTVPFGGILLYGEESNTALTIDSAVTLTAKGAGNGAPAIYVEDTTASTEGIIVGGSLPDGAQITSTTGAENIYNWTLSDALGNPLTSVTINAKLGQDSPSITTAALKGGYVGDAYTDSLAAVPAVESRAISWSITSGALPAGLSLNTDGTISGTPSAAGNFDFIAKAVEAGGGFATKRFTITIIARAEAGDLAYTPGTYYPGDKFPVTVPMTAALSSGDSGSLALSYNDGGEKTLECQMIRGSNYFYAYPVIPQKTSTISAISFSGTVGGRAVEKQSAVSGVELGGTVKVQFSGGTSADVTVASESGYRTIYPGLASGRTITLPAGEYTVSFSGIAAGRGVISLAGDEQVTVSAGSEQTITCGLASTETTSVPAKVCFEGEETEVARFGDYALRWYRGNGADKVLLSVAESYPLLGSENDIYVQALPCNWYAAFYDESALTPATSNMTITIPKQQTISVSGQMSCTGLSGDPNFGSAGRVTVIRPGMSAQASYGVWTDASGYYSVDGATAGSVITFSPKNSIGWAPVEYTVTTVDIDRGSLTLNLTAPLSSGVISFSSVVCRGVSDDDDYEVFLRNLNNIKLTRADGTPLSYRFVGDNTIAINDTSGLSAGDTVTLSADYGYDSEFPVGHGTVQLTLSGDRLTCQSAKLVIDRHGRAYMNAANPYRTTGVLLLYDASGTLRKTTRGTLRADLNSVSWSSPYLAAGNYTLYAVQKDYFDSLDPQSYANAPAFESGAYAKKSFTVTNGTYQEVEMSIPSLTSTQCPFSYESSSLTMSADYPDTVTVDLSATLRTGASIDLSRGVEIHINTNQSDPYWQSGAVNTVGLSINGKAVDISRFDGNGRMEGDGKLPFILNAEKLSEYGGFPMSISAVVNRSVPDSLKAEAYIKYYTAGGEQRYALLGTYSQEVPQITLEAPFMTAETEVTVYGSASANDIVSISCNGALAARVKADGRGYYTAIIALDSPVEFDSFLLSAATADSVSAPVSVLYAPSSSSIKGITIFWKSHNYDAAYKSLPVWENGAASSMYKSYYRGAVGADSDEKIYWEIEFNQPDSVGTVMVNVPRNGALVELEATRVGTTAVFRTEPYFFYGSAPSGMYVAYSGDINPGIQAKTPILDNDFAKGVEMLNNSNVISSMAGTSDDFSFDIINDEGRMINARMTTTSESISQKELTALEALKSPSGFPEYIKSYHEGYLADADGYWATDRICKFTTAGGDIYRRELYTLSKRIVVMYDIKAGTATTTTLTLGQGGNQPGEYSGFSDAVKEYKRTDQIHTVWMSFYSRLADGIIDARTSQLALFSPPFKPGEMIDRAQGIADDSSSWAEGAEIKPEEIRKIKDFLDDNPGLIQVCDAFAGEQNNEYSIIDEINTVYFVVGMGELDKIVAFATGGVPSNADEVGELIVEGAKDYVSDYAKGEIFFRQAENLAFELYLAAKKAERRERDSTRGGLLPEGIDWSRFPKDLYDYEKYGIGTQKMPKYPQGRYDPAGYIYEAVPSNRLSGATVELYTYEGGAVFADASSMGIEPNPQITGVDGRYQWFVPEGYWQVRASKAGYDSVSTGGSDKYGIGAKNTLSIGNQPVTAADYWMPVLPVQLDVNIALVSYEPPAVASVSAAEDGVYVTFTKYMDEVLPVSSFQINGLNPSVVTAQDAESADASHTYARTFLLSYPAGLTPQEGEDVNLFVDKSVESYSGVNMASSFTKTVTVAPLERVAMPVPSIQGGQVAENTAVFLSTATTGAAIYYTVDGTAPSASSTRYSGCIMIDSATTIKAIAVKPAMRPSQVLTVSYTVPVIAPIIAPARKSDSSETPPQAEAAEWVNPYKDVSETAWYYQDIEFACSNGLFVGISEDTFAPNAPMTRAMLVTVMWRLDGEPVAAGQSGFTDLTQDWYTDAVKWAAVNGIVDGYGNGKFGPDDSITRQQMAALLWRYAKYKGYDVSAGEDTNILSYNDAFDIAEYAIPAFQWACGAGLVQGDGENLMPQGNALRCQVAAILHRFCDSITK